jgi:hypothetical protein
LKVSASTQFPPSLPKHERITFFDPIASRIKPLKTQALIGWQALCTIVSGVTPTVKYVLAREAVGAKNEVWQQRVKFLMARLRLGTFRG